VYNNTLAAVKRQIQQAENPMPAVVISVDAARVDNAILLEYLASVVAPEEPEIGSTDPNTLIDNNCKDDELLCRMPGGSGYYKDESDESDVRDAIPTAGLRRRATTELERFDRGNSDDDGYKGDHGDNAYAHEQGESLQPDDESTQNVRDCGHCRFDMGTSDVNGYECEHGNDADADEKK